MSSVPKLQTKIHTLTSGLFATWLPDDRLDIGDYGMLGNGRFHRDGNLKRIGIDFIEEASDPKKGSLKYSDGVRFLSETEFSGSDELVGINADGRIEFSKEGAFIFHLMELTHRRIERRDEFLYNLAQAIITGKIKWQDGYVLIDELRDCSRYWIMLSEAQTGVARIKGSAGLTESINLADAGLSVSSTSGSILDYSNGENGRPLYHAIKPVVVEGPTGGGGLKMMLKYLWEFFGDRYPKPEEINITTYQGRMDVFEIKASRQNIATEFRLEFMDANLDDILNETDQILGPSEEGPAVEEFKIQQNWRFEI